MKRILTTLVVLVSLGVAGEVFAQDSEVDTRFIDFGDMLIDGEFQRPEGMFATERGQAQFNSLLNLRRSFIDEIGEAAREESLQ